MGVRGWLTALRIDNGQIVWRAYSTGPDRDVLIGPRFKPFYSHSKGADLGIHTWPGEAWKQGGGTTWGWISYDPSLNLIYYGTGNPGPWNHEQRPGDNKWTSGLFARDVDTGEAVWFYHTDPHDLFDYDDINESVLVDLPIGGTTRKVLLRPNRDGYVYVIDRITGEALSADPYVHITSTKGIDLKKGRPIEDESKKPVLGKVIHEICPASPGGKDWQPSAYSTRTGYLYIPANNLCMDFESLEANYIAGTPFVGANANALAKKAAESFDLRAVRRWLMVLTVMGLGAVVVRGFEYTQLNTWWDDNAYGSITWVLLSLHTIHVATDVVDGGVMTALMFIGPVTERRFVDVSENSLYWYFIVAWWIPIYLTIYWAPRWL